MRTRLQTAWDLFVASDPAASRLIRALEAGLGIGAPVPTLAVMAGALALSSHLVPGLVVLTPVTGLGTWVRALVPVIGPRAILYGMMLFMGYCFGFLSDRELPVSDIDWLAAIVWLAALVNLALRLSVFNRAGGGTVARGRLSFTARAAAASTARELPAAVIAVFISFIGANTASEQLAKAVNRVVGTLVGIKIGSLTPSDGPLAEIADASERAGAR